MKTQLIFTSFNSTLVQLKARFTEKENVSTLGFQFYLSSIKSQINNEFNASEACFNSTLVQLKAVLTLLITMASTSFNSTLVQLKVSIHKEINVRNISFNSTLVQLKAVKNANKYTSKSMIYHPFILIFYKHLQSTFNS